MIDPPRNVIPPAVAGMPQVGQTLPASFGEWAGWPTLAFQWRRGAIDIDGAAASTYVLADADAGAMISCVVIATNEAGSAEAASAPVGPVVEFGQASR
jgi:hypothetical protein